jgi:hypothetical protein
MMQDDAEAPAPVALSPTTQESEAGAARELQRQLEKLSSQLQKVINQRYKIGVLVKPIQGLLYARISAQVC